MCSRSPANLSLARTSHLAERAAHNSGPVSDSATPPPSYADRWDRNRQSTGFNHSESSHETESPLPRGETSNVIYRIQCDSCEVNYVRETVKRWQTRVTEHVREVAVESGIPQGSVLGPILFLICIYDPVTGLDCDTAMFADDINIWKVIRNEADEANLQAKLHRLEEWSNNWLLPFNATKCNILRIGRTSSGHHKMFYLDYTPLPELRGDLIQAFRMLRGHDCCLASGDFFELATTTTLRGHPIKLRLTGARPSTRRFFFSNRVIKAWNALPADIIMSPSVDTFNWKFNQYSQKYHHDIRN
ncbi:unnamed protein product [Schistocephalus solidus]|uniref:Reverse transcriptase domain-containing protein n=1 Tax=Schistocephalus solidus TaxID=70667 RepID=A0A183TIB4_SCHSO|nr:unnamed protein product [Schistocephalus solidus]